MSDAERALALLTGIEDGNHALLVGNIAGALMASLRDDGDPPTKVTPIVDRDGNYTNQITIARPSGTYTLTVTKD